MSRARSSASRTLSDIVAYAKGQDAGDDRTFRRRLMGHLTAALSRPKPE